MLKPKDLTNYLGFAHKTSNVEDFEMFCSQTTVMGDKTIQNERTDAAQDPI